MVSATWTMACLLFVAGGAGPEDPVFLNQRAFLLPININPEKRSDVHQVLLFQENKEGTRWEQVGAILPDKEGFPFNAPEDGTYLFKVAVVGRDGRRDPFDIYKAPLNKRVVVDMVPPIVRLLTAERVGEEVKVRWEIIETYPDLATLRLEYRTSDTSSGLWTPITISNPQSGQAFFGAPGAVAVRMQVQDLAKNVSSWAEATVGSGSLPGGNSTSTLPPLLTPEPSSSGGVSRTTNVAPMPPANEGGAWSPRPPGNSLGTQPVSGSLDPVPSSLVGKEPLPVGPGSTATPPVVASAGSSATSNPGLSAPGSGRPGRLGLPPLQMTNKRQITLEYEVAKFGPSGVGKVELWVTRDDGQSWQKSGGDMNVNTPLPGDAKVGTGALKQSLVVDLHEDGIYGFILTVKSGAGLGKPAPRSGDVPHMRVEVDTKAPKATLFRPEPDPTRRDTLILRWTAQDNNLGPTPFSLQWAEKKGGKWEPIGSSELPNSQGQVSSYAWQVPADIPHHVFLRLTVRDTAGNVAIAETDEPVLVDLNEPEVQSLRLGSSPR